jgi:hypothetical protein
MIRARNRRCGVKPRDADHASDGQAKHPLERLLAERGDQAVGLIRNPAHAADVQKTGAVTMAAPHSRRLAPVTALKAASVVLVAVGAVWAGHAAWAAFTGQGTPSCSWPLHVRGKPAPGQVGLMRCYLKALAHRDAAGLLAIAEAPSPVRITKADLRHSADARAGLATVTFAPRVLDPNSASWASSMPTAHATSSAFRT